jgi:hypothetical protein
MRRSRSKRKRCPLCDGNGFWWTETDYDTSPDERPCEECQQAGWIPRKIWLRRKRHKREMNRSIHRWIIRMGRARGLDGMPALIQPHTPANIEVGGGWCLHPKTRIWPRFGRVSHRSMLANWVKCTMCYGSGVLDDVFGVREGDPCIECTGRGHTAGLLLIMQARDGAQ